jgi:hypothetical protein
MEILYIKRTDINIQFQNILEIVFFHYLLTQ